MMEENNGEELLGNLLGKGSLLDLRLSASRISAYDQDGPKTLVKKKELSGEGITIGGLVDLLLFEPDMFKDSYYVFKTKVPTGMAKELVEIISNNYNKVPTREQVYNIAKEANLWKSIVKEDTYYSKFDNNDFWDYLKAIYESKGKTIVSEEDHAWAQQLVEVLKTHEYSKNIVAYPKKHEDKYAQYEVEFEYNNVMIRGFLDLLVVNHKTKSIQLIDLKTGAPNSGAFTSSFIKYRYYIQAAIYTLAVPFIKDSLELEDYTVLPFQFLYIGRFEQIPIVYEVTDKWHRAAIEGFTTRSGYKNKGIKELIEEIAWHWTNKCFQLSKEAYEAKGQLTLKDDFIEVYE